MIALSFRNSFVFANLKEKRFKVHALSQVGNRPRHYIEKKKEKKKSEKQKKPMKRSQKIPEFSS